MILRHENMGEETVRSMVAEKSLVDEFKGHLLFIGFC